MTEEVEVKKSSFWMAAKYRLAIAGVMLSGLVGMASATAIDLGGITDVLQAFIGIIPDIMDLVMAIIPLMFTLALYSFILGLLLVILDAIKVKF